MKRAGNLFERVLERDNLRLAVVKAMRGKRDRPEVVAFLQDLDRQLEAIAEQVRAGTFPLGRFRQFIRFDPKERVITAPCFPERVLHHAVTNICEPAFDNWLVADTYACRAGKGRLAALVRAQQFARRFPFFLKLDIRKYFDSVPHDRLLELLARRFLVANCASAQLRLGVSQNVPKCRTRKKIVWPSNPDAERGARNNLQQFATINVGS